MKITHRHLLVLPLLTAALLVSGCNQASDDVDPDPEGTSQRPPHTPGESDTVNVWVPATPSSPADPTSAQSTYAPVLDAAITAVNADLTWSDIAVTTELFDEQCVVKVERVGSGVLVPGVEGLQDTLATVLADHDFPDLAPKSDPGGALLYVAHDSSDALFEFRSKGETTVAVRVATVASECPS